MKKDNVVEFCRPEAVDDPLTGLLRQGVRKLIHQAIESELCELLEGYAHIRDEYGRRAVVRNGRLPERDILTGIGPVSVRIPKVRSRTGETVVFRSSLVPPYVRKARRVEAALPWLYLKGISTGKMREALEVLVGSEARGLSPSVVSRLKREWEAEYEDWRKKDLSKDRWVYLWVDGIYSGLRSEQQKLCVLVVIGVNERGEKHFLAIEDGVRESTQSWREVLLDMKERGLERPPSVAVGDGALGFWAAVDEVYPETRHQRCWVHKMANVLNYLPKSVQPKAKKDLQEIWMSPDRKRAERAFDYFVHVYGAKYPRAVKCLVKDRDSLLTFYDFPAEYWVHIRTTNPIESTFATVRHRSDRVKGCVSRQTMLAMIYKLGMSAEKRWRRIRGFGHLVKVIKGVKFKDGMEINDKTEDARIAA